MRASTPAASSDADGAYVVRQFRGPKGPPHSFTNHEDNAILRAFARYAAYAECHLTWWKSKQSMACVGNSVYNPRLEPLPGMQPVSKLTS